MMFPVTIILSGTSTDNLQQAICKLYLGQSIVHVILSPHIEEALWDWNTYLKKTEALCQWVNRENLPVLLHTGAVVPLGRALELLQRGSTRYCLADSPYVLLSATGESHEEIGNIIFQLMLKGFCPILETPEKICIGRHGLSYLLRCMRKGVLSVCDLESLSGGYGSKIQQNTQVLIKNNMVCLWEVQADHMAEDFDLSRHLQKIFDAAGPEYGQAMLYHYPEQLRKNEFFYLSLPESIKYRGKGLLDWLARILSR